MRDPKPVFWVFVLQILGVVALLGWWVTLPPQERTHLLVTIHLTEQATLAPPPALLDQFWWLVDHRTARLLRMAWVLILGVAIGLGEGLWERHKDVMSGFHLRAWTLGVMGMALFPGLLAGACLMPLAWSLVLVAAILTGYLIVTYYCLAIGAPSIS